MFKPIAHVAGPPKVAADSQGKYSVARPADRLTTAAKKRSTDATAGAYST